MEEVKNTNQVQQSKTKKIVFYTTITVLAAVVVFLIINLTTTKSRYNSLLADKEFQKMELIGELDSLMSEHEQIKVSYGELSQQLAEKDSVINAEATEIKRLLNYEWEYKKIKKKFNQLQAISKSYIGQMDSLYQVNASLREENTQIKNDIQVERKKNVVLMKEKEQLTKKIETASTIAAFDVSANSFHLTGTKERETDKAKRTNLIRVCFSLMENKIIEPGNINVYVRIAMPDGAIICDTSDDAKSFDFNGNILQYTVKQSIDYDGNMIDDICVEWEKTDLSESLPEGTYYVNLFTETLEIGQTHFILK